MSYTHTQKKENKPEIVAATKSRIWCSKIHFQIQLFGIVFP